ncbi:bifunctional 4-hydroxy-3-methylbut-2-enyl diphosphate reductase/30S ribosomal protein S1 [Mogibacterium sp. CM50]|uniref:bifunctional 4-hydroxy-3-methylbut-2-enyl diphosphate reductase/30S ribosomal protein S1 n=1 Tax=Mogibacterium sp. CM50 TaxID=936375 RepID=UPI00027C6324|nr:bifunctional 4-hydroxy-3-methylbut-2-enyl diphosphate reductase/30S ribosomal protein S1 [Mogibacterium sp. CM50]EJU19223.1 4-hydroxy-3-methylbut-2-enyl diphosphate reductase [Mogibacterium sp. CM50]
MEIIRAEHSGFCFGVQKAIDKTFERIDEAKRDCRTTYTCGNLIHNKAVINKVASKGVCMISSLDEATSGDVVIVRSHGEPKEFYDKAENYGIELVDTTCVFVKKIHELVYKAYLDCRPVIIVGSADHQEVKATNGWCNYTAIILGNAQEARDYAKNCCVNQIPLVVCQTTIRRELLDSIIEVFDEAAIPYEIKNTICNATRDRQESCAELAAKVDCMVVIGDPSSSNSKKLYEITNNNCKNAMFIQDISDLELKELHNYNKIGITAGASTPEWIIKEVIASMSENVTANVDHNPMLDFMDDIENSLRLPRPGEIVDGTVHQVMDNEVIVNIGCKKDGILQKSEVTLEPGQTLVDLFKEGDEIQAKVMKSDDGEGGILLSKKRLEMNENFKELAAAQANKEIISVKLVKSVNSGVIAAYKEISGFIPLSQLSDRYVENADEFLGQTVDVEVIKVDNKRNRAVFSRKAVLVDEKRKQIAEIWANLNVGDIVEGKVMRFTDYGAFVDIGGVDGLLHISEISWGKLKHPKEVLNIGDIINVKILALNEEKGKISLGLKQTQPEPWSLVGSKYEVGQVIEGKVVQIKDYGAFVELEAGLDGLVHISEIANRRVENVSDELELGKIITAKIMEIDVDRKRISLSIKALLGDEEESEVEATEE